MRKRITIGIVGFGQMGQFVAKLLSSSADIVAFDPQPAEAKTEIDIDSRIRRVDIQDAAAREIVFLFPPIDRIGECCRSIRDHVRPGAIIIEGCSVMCIPIEQMKVTLPDSVDLVGCHPLFGPQSAAQGVKGLKLVLAPVRTNRLSEIAALFLPFGIEIVNMTPEEHDRALARTQALEQFFGRILINLGIDDEPIDVPGYRKLVDLKRLLASDSEELFVAIQKQNPFAAETVDRIKAAWFKTLRALELNPQEFER